MSLARVLSRGHQGLDSPLVTVEVHICNGLPQLAIVGLPETAVKESKDRVRSALLHAGFDFPAQRITVNLAPADLPKNGGRFDLPIALGILAASRQIPLQSLDAIECVGELSLGGELRTVTGMLPIALAATREQHGLILPADNAPEAALACNAAIYPARHLMEVCEHLNGRCALQAYTSGAKTASCPPRRAVPDFSEVQGHFQAKRALEIAAAGRHNLLMQGPPGTGKSMLAQRLPGILPMLEDAEALEAATIASISGHALNLAHWRAPNYRSPHHTASAMAIVGGGNPPLPGEISLAHLGVLFLDELPEYKRAVLESMREPLETGRICLSRAAHQVEYPARFQLIAAMNPCPCGYLGDPSDRCRCSPLQINRYRARISGPLLDRIDMHIIVKRQIEPVMLAKDPRLEPSAIIAGRVLRARQRAQARSACPNAWLTPDQLLRDCRLDEAGETLLQQASHTWGLSHRGCHRLIKLARTIADLAESVTIEVDHLAEALVYRMPQAV